jgi:hypothetical protein
MRHIRLNDYSCILKDIISNSILERTVAFLDPHYPARDKMEETMQDIIRTGRTVKNSLRPRA